MTAARRVRPVASTLAEQCRPRITWQRSLPAVGVALLLGLAAAVQAAPPQGALPAEPLLLAQALNTTPPRTESFEPQVGQAGKDVVWVPTPEVVVDSMLDMAKVKAGDFVVDLGAGDGRIAIAAAKRGARALGIEYNPNMVELARRNARQAGVKNVEFRQGDIFQSDFSQADVITLYLLPTLNERLRPILLDMKPGTRVASHQFTMGEWQADQTTNLDGRQALFWIVPAKVGGEWTAQVQGEGAVRFSIEQKYQKISGEGAWGDRRGPLTEPQLSGGQISFVVNDGGGKPQRFAGTVDHNGRMSGTVTDAQGRSRPFTATRTKTGAPS
ncbi:MAG: methyltransferase domain-containing protein [Burkholderiales bacterium]|nr:methyltransferase domain-containing protein [Burkholderiales bacterium]